MKGLRNWFQRTVLARPWLAFLVMGLSFFLFGASSLNLFRLFYANFDLIATHGWQALQDGGLRQLVELAFNGYFSVAAYLIFKTCESRLVDVLRNDTTR